MNNPRFLICDPLPSEVHLYPAEYMLDTEFGILWSFDELGNGSVSSWLTEPIKDAQILAQASREAGEWFAKYLKEEE